VAAIDALRGAAPAPAAPDSSGAKAQNMAGSIETKSGRRLAYALMVNDVGAIEDIEGDVSEVFEDGAAIANAVYEGVR
jgi:D-alanyl-D-alanine carboxypeptidase